MTDLDKLKGIVADISSLLAKRVRSSDPEFEAWHMRAERFLIKKYGNGSLEHDKFINTRFSPIVYNWDMDEEEVDRLFRERCREGLRSCQAVFGTYLEDIADEETSSAPVVDKVQPRNMDRIFIVHGHDGKLQQSVARIIEKQEIKPIILSEQANQGRTIIEKFEDNSDVGGAICLFTADDLGRAKAQSNDQPRARQNVVLETGYFMGKLGRDHVVLLADKGIEMPSDLSGVVYTDTGSWQFALLKELAAMGYKVDLNKLL